MTMFQREAFKQVLKFLDVLREDLSDPDLLEMPRQDRAIRLEALRTTQVLVVKLQSELGDE